MTGPRDILDEKGKRLYDTLAQLIPGFHPVLDQTILTLYVDQLRVRYELRTQLGQAPGEQERRVLNEMLQEREQNLRVLAEKLGLTPRSHLEILRNMRRRRPE